MINKDFKITHNELGQPDMRFDECDSLLNQVYTSLDIRQGSPQGLFEGYGSRLHTINTITEANVNLAKQYAKEATDWILEAQLASSINITSFAVTGGISIIVETTQAQNELQKIPFSRLYNDYDNNL